MATTNTFIKPQVVARLALANLYSQCVMLPLVHRDFSADFASGVGDTVLVRKPAVLTATRFDRSVGIVPQNITETSIPVVLDLHDDVSVELTDHVRTMDIKDLTSQVIQPAMEAIAQSIDQAILSLRTDIVQEVGVAGGTTTGVSGVNTFAVGNPRCTIDAERVLNIRKVPPSMRSVVVGPTTKARWLEDDLFSRNDQRGDTDGLRDAYLGAKVYGFDPYMTQNVDGANEENVAFHQTAFAFVTRPLALPLGANSAENISYNGLTMRVVYSYDQTYKKDVMSMDILYGVKTLDANRAVLLTAAGS